MGLFGPSLGSGLLCDLCPPFGRHARRSRRAAFLAHGGRGRIDAALFRRRLAILDLAGQDIDHELGELVSVTRALLAFRA